MIQSELAAIARAVQSGKLAAAALTPDLHARVLSFLDRPANMERRYQAGETLVEIGARFGVTRERVRQILRQRGVTRNDGGACRRWAQEGQRRAAEQAAKHLQRHGCTREQRLSVPRAARTAYREQRNNANKRDIPWHFTLWSWWQFWQKSGKWGERGRTRDAYVMSRPGDSGPYGPDNVHIIRQAENAREYYDREREIYGRVRSGPDRRAA